MLPAKILEVSALYPIGSFFQVLRVLRIPPENVRGGAREGGDGYVRAIPPLVVLAEQEQQPKNLLFVSVDNF